MSRPDSFGIFDFETEVLTRPSACGGNAPWARNGVARTTHRRIFSDKSGAFGLDLDSWESPVYGQQEGAA